MEWAQLYFIENNGMAFGLEFGGEWGKILLTSFRIVAVIAIGLYMRSLIRQKAHTGFILTLAMVMAGALGNIIDSIFYGVIYGGYAPDFQGKLFQGRVVDMFYFPIIRTDNFTFFKPVFNIADSSITVAVATILIFQKRFFRHLQKEEEATA
jgi:signal peptidase II